MLIKVEEVVGNIRRNCWYKRKKLLVQVEEVVSVLRLKRAFQAEAVGCDLKFKRIELIYIR